MSASESSTGFTIVAREDFSDVTYLLEISHPMMARAARPGQFAIVMEHEHGSFLDGLVTATIQDATPKRSRRGRRGCDGH